MPYESPNIVLVPTKPSIAENIVTDKNKHIEHSLSHSYVMPNKTNAVVTGTPSTAIVTQAPSTVIQNDNINKRANPKTASQGSISKAVEHEISKKSIDTEVSQNVKEPVVSISNYKLIVGENFNADPIKVNLTPYDVAVTKQMANNTGKNNQEIKLNLLSRPTETMSTNTTAGALIAQTSNFNTDIQPLDTCYLQYQFATPTNHWNHTSFLQAPTNLGMEPRSCIGTTFTSSSPLYNSTNIITDFGPTWTPPSLIETCPYQNIGMGPTFHATWPCPPQFETRSSMDTTWTQSQFHLPLEQNIYTSPYMHTTSTCPLELPTHSNISSDFRPRMDTKTYFMQQSHINTQNETNDSINSSLVTSEVHEELSKYTKTTHDITSSSLKSRMDYTWLTRAHYANINQSNKTLSKVKSINASKNTEKHVKNTLPNSPTKSSMIPKSNSISINKKYSNEKLPKSDKDSQKLYSENANKYIDKKIREREKNNIKEEIKALEMKIKKLQNNKVSQVLSTSKKEVPSKIKSKLSSQTKLIKSKSDTKKILDNTDNGKKQTSQKRSLNTEQTFKKRVRFNSEELEHKRIHRKLDIKNSRHSKSEKLTHSHRSNQKEIREFNVDITDKLEDRSKHFEINGSEKLPTKRKYRDSSDESIPKKRFRLEAENINNNVKSSHIKSIVTSTKPTVKHPRVYARESNDSGVAMNCEADFDLRSKLSRKNYKLYTKNKMCHESQVYDKTEKPRENLSITVHPNIDDKTIVSSQESSNSKQKTKKIKKIRLVINVIQEDTSDDSSSDVNEDNKTDVNNKTFTNQKSDLSFLDDINIDEIVNSLQNNPQQNNFGEQQNIQKDHKAPPEFITDKLGKSILFEKDITTQCTDTSGQKPTTYPEQKLMSSNKSTTNKFVQPILIKKEPITNLINSQTQPQQNVVNIKTTTGSNTNKFVQPIIIKKEILFELIEPKISTNHEAEKAKFISENFDLINSQTQPQQIVDNMKTTTESNTNKFVQPIIIKKEILSDHIESIINTNKKVEEAKSPTKSTTDNFNLINSQTQPQQNVDSIKTTTESNTNKFVQPIIIKKEILSDHIEPKINTNKKVEKAKSPTKSITDSFDLINLQTQPQQIVDNIKIVQPIIIKKEILSEHIEPKKNTKQNVEKAKSSNKSITENFDLIYSQTQPQKNVVNIKTTTESNTNKFVQPIIIKKEILSEHIEPKINMIQIVEKAKSPIKSIPNNLDLINLQTQLQLNVDNIKTTTGSITNKFVQPIIIKKEILSEYIEPTLNTNQKVEKAKSPTKFIRDNFDLINSQRQPQQNVDNIKDPLTQLDIKNLKESAFENLKTSGSLKSNIQVERSDNICTAGKCITNVSLHEIKQEVHEDQAIYTEHLNTDNLYHQTSLKKHDSQTSDQLIDTRVENTQPLLTSSGATEIMCAIESEPSDNYLEKQFNKDLSGVFEKKIQDNTTSDARTVTITYPTNKDLAIQIENRLQDYLKHKFTVMSVLHHGKFSKVFKCKDANDKKYAIKILRNNKNTNSDIKKQKMLKELLKDIPKNNSNIVHLVNGFAMDQTWCFLMEYYPKTLAYALKNTVFNMDTIHVLSKQLISAVLVMRNNKIVHSDIKPNHILLDSKHTKLKVCGFDEAYYAEEKTVVLPNIGTVHYRAPEIILGHSAVYSVDVWATAVVMYEIATGYKLFPTSYNSDLLFSQMCLCGQLPMDMMLNSKYSSVHFAGKVFRRIIGPNGEHELYSTDNLNTKHYTYDILKKICNQRWRKYRPDWKQAKDTAKLAQMSRLLDKMFVLDPNRRLPIEYVYSDPFFMYKSK